MRFRRDVWMLYVASLALAACACSCQESSPGSPAQVHGIIEEVESVEPQFTGLELGWIGSGRRIEIATVVRLRLDVKGELAVMKDGGWTRTTRQDCGIVLSSVAEQYDRTMQAWLESGFDRGPASSGSRVIVEIDVHPHTRWFDLHKALDLCRWAGYNKVQINVDNDRVNLVLPADSSASFLPPNDATLTTVYTFGRGETEIRSGGAMRRPATVVYRVDGDEILDLRSVSKYLSRVAKKKDRVLGAAQFEGNVSVRSVVDVLRTFIEAGIQHVDVLERLE